MHFADMLKSRHSAPFSIEKSPPLSFTRPDAAIVLFAREARFSIEPEPAGGQLACISQFLVSSHNCDYPRTEFSSRRDTGWPFNEQSNIEPNTTFVLSNVFSYVDLVFYHCNQR